MTATSRWPLALIAVIALCLLRGLIGLRNMWVLVPYLLRGQYPISGTFYVYLLETLLFIAFGLWLLGHSHTARLATIGLCGFAVVNSSYGFLSRQFHGKNTATTVTYFVAYLAADFLTILYLSSPSLKALFSAGEQPPTHLPPSG